MNENKKSQLTYGIKFAAFATLVILIAVVSLYSAKSYTYNREPLEVNEASFINPITSLNNIFASNNNNESVSAGVRDTINLRKGKHTFRFNEKENGDKKSFKAKLNDGKIEDLYIDGEQIPENELGNYQHKIDQNIDDYELAISDLKNYKEELKKLRDDNAQKMKELRNKLKEYRNYDNDFEFDEDYPSLDLSELREAMRELRVEFRDNFASHSFVIPPVPPIPVPDMDIPEIHVPPIHIPPINITLPHFNNENMNEWRHEFKKNMKDLSENMKEHKWKVGVFGDSMKVFGGKMRIFGIEMKKFGRFMKAAKNEMVDDNLIGSEDDIDNFYLSEDKMSVNDKSVSQDLHKKYIDMYEKYIGKKLTDDKKIEINNWY